MHFKLGGLGMKMFGFDVHEGELPPNSERFATVWWPYVDTCIEAFGLARAGEKADLSCAAASGFYRLGIR